jgi:glycosyltransferase involved in cell wall biosynthesis
VASIQLIALTSRSHTGLAADTEILTTVLTAAGHHVVCTRGQAVGPSVLQPPRATPKQRLYDLNVFIEHCGPQSYLDQYLREASLNVFMPNAEWFLPDWLPCLDFADAIWAKTADAERIFGQLCPQKVAFTSFSSRDHFVSGPKRPLFFHGPGFSDLKGTETVIRLWEEEGAQFPPLHFYFSEMLVASKMANLFTQPHIVKRMGRWAPPEYASIQSQYWFHLCPSGYEGFGHYIHEAKSTGAVVITTDAPPMNEFVTPDFGILIPPAKLTPLNLALVADVDPSMLGRLLRQYALPLLSDLSRLEEMGRRARLSYLGQDAAFRRRLPQIVTGLLKQSASIFLPSAVALEV